MTKGRQYVAGLVAIAGLLGSVYAQETTTKQETRRQETTIRQDTKDTRDMKHSEGEVRHAGALLVPASVAEGTTVLGADKNPLGTVKDIIVRGSSGRVVYALISKGMEPSYNRVVPVPFAAFSWDAERKQLTIPMNEEQFRAAASFNQEDWRTLSEPAMQSNAYSYFKVPQDRAAEDVKVYRVRRVSTTETTRDNIHRDHDEKVKTERSTKTEEKTKDGDKITKEEKSKHEERTKVDTKNQPDTARRDTTRTDRDGKIEPGAMKGEPGALFSVGEVKNKPLLSQEGRELGLVNDIVFDAPSGRIAFLVVTPSANMEAGEGRLGIPWPNFEVDQVGRLYALDIDKNALRSAPRLTQPDWSELQIENYTDDMYSRYGYDPTPWRESTVRTTTTRETTMRDNTKRDATRETVRETKGEVTTRDNDRWRTTYRTALDTGSPRTVKGRIESIEETTIKDGDNTTRIRVVNVKMDNGETVAVHTAPLSWWQRQTLKLNPGDTVTMSGKDITLEGKKTYCATEVVSADGSRVVIHEMK